MVVCHSLRALATKIYKSNKAKRAYVSALMLKERSFDAPEPVAFVSYRQNWLNATYYFVSLRSEYRHSMEDIPSLEPEMLEKVTADFARYAARLHPMVSCIVISLPEISFLI